MPDILPRIKRSYPAPRHFSATGYDAAEDRGRRRPPRTTTSHEDSHANERRRIILSATARDLARNYAIASWAIRKHLDYVADFTFQASTPDPGFNAYVEQWWKGATKKHRFDVASRHPHRRALRLAEAGRVVDGDSFWMLLAPPAGDPTRGTIQPIEGDRVAMPAGSVPNGTKPADWINGILVDQARGGRALAYGICDRIGDTQKKLQRTVAARNIIPHAAYEFRTDQVRGVSPIAAGLNAFQDTYEATEYALAKLKVHQLFGIAIKTTDTASAFPQPPADTSTLTEDEAEDAAEAANADPRIDLKRGPFVSELEPGEEIDTIESKTPSTETVNFLKLMIHIALRSLDIPYSFFDESFTNFYGSRGGLIQYLHSCHNKVLDLQDFLDEHARWRMGLAIEDGELELPSGKDFSYLNFEFVPGGVPWWDSTKEARGAAMAIAMGASSPQRVCRENGTNFKQNIDETSEALAYAKAKNVSLNFGDATAFAPEIVQTAEGATDEN